jgi:hypothetical protein
MVDSSKDLQSNKLFFPKEKITSDDWDDEIIKPKLGNTLHIYIGLFLLEPATSQDLKLKSGAKNARSSELIEIPDEEVWKNVETRMDR